MRLKDYTQKTQQLAAEKTALSAKEKEWQAREQAYQNELAAIDQFLKDQAAIDAYREKAFGKTQVTPPVQLDPNTPITPEQVAQIARYNAEQVRLDTDKQLAALREEQARNQQRLQQAQENEARQKLANEVDSYIAGLVSKNPLLKRFEGIEDELIGMAGKFQPRTLDEAKTRLTEAAERKLATIKSIVEEEKKAAAIEAAKLKKTSTEPAGGQTPTSQQTQKRVTMDVKDRRDRLADNEAWLREAMAGGN